VPNNAMNEVYRQFRTAQDKYVYFILAATGACVALAVNQTRAVALSYWQIPLGCAVLSWAISFFSGCRFVQYTTSSLYSNLELFLVEQGIHPDCEKHPQVIQAASEGIRMALNSNSQRACKLCERQFTFLIIGAVLYLAWHILEMGLRSAN